MLRSLFKKQLPVTLVVLGLLLLGFAVREEPAVAQQQDSVPIADLPYCPDWLYQEPLEAPTVPPDLNAPTTCRLNTIVIDRQALLDQGYKPEELPGSADAFIPGQSNVIQSSEISNATGTTLYLPLLVGNAHLGIVDSSVVSTPTTASTNDLVPADLPYCPDWFYTQPAESTLVPDLNAPTSCKAKTTFFDVKALLDQGYTLEELGVSADPPLPGDIISATVKSN